MAYQTDQYLNEIPVEGLDSPAPPLGSATIATSKLVKTKDKINTSGLPKTSQYATLASKVRFPQSKLLYYPSRLDLFPNVFVKMEFYDRKNPYDVKNSKVDAIYPPHSVIYLPFPQSEGLLQKDLFMNWEYNELGITGEYAKRNTDNIVGSLEKFGQLNFTEGGNQLSKLFSANGFRGAVDAFLERALLDTRDGSAARKAITQGTGYGFAPHKTLMFNGMNLPGNQMLEFGFTAKNVEDARMLENISKEIQKASLPELKEEQFKNEILPWFGIGSENTETNETKKETKSDVWIDSKAGGQLGAGNRQYFSSTFDLPMRLHLKVMKKKNYGERKESAVEAEELYVFPMPFLISDVSVEQSSGGTNMSNERSMIKHINSEGETEFYNQKFTIVINIQEETIYTSEKIVDHTKKM